MIRNIAIVARDVGPCNALKHVVKVLDEKGNLPRYFFGNGVPFPEEDEGDINQAVAEADCVLIALSSTKERSREEMLAANLARAMGKKLAIFCNTWGEYRRPWMQNIVKNADLLFVLSEGEADAAREFAPKAEIIPSGNPDWATYFTSKTTREEVRTRFDLLEEHVMILLALSKEADRNAPLIQAVHELVEEKMKVPRIPIWTVITRHPGDQTPADQFEKMVGGYWCNSVLDKEDQARHWGTQDLLPGADVVITSLSAVSVAGACQRKKVIEWATNTDRKWWQNISGTQTWEPSDVWKTSMLASNPDQLDSAFTGLGFEMDYWGMENMKKFQEKYLRPEMFEKAAETIANALLR